MKIESMRWLKSQLKHKVSITKGLLIAFMITGTVMSYSEGSEESVSSNQSSSGVNVTINNYGEQTSLELGDNSRARGIGSVSTGRNGIAVGNNAVATGENETKETIERKLEENKQKLEEIANAKKEIADKAEELRLKQISERETIEAGIRVEDLRNAKEVAREHWQNKLSAYNQKKSENEVLLTDYKNKIADLNRRLNAVGSLGDINISSAEGLDAAADKLKTKVEENTNLNLTKEFYKDYVVNYYKVLGDLRKNEQIWDKTRGHSNGLTMSNYEYLKEHNPNMLKPNLEDIIIPTGKGFFQNANPHETASTYSRGSDIKSSTASYSSKHNLNLAYNPDSYNSLGSYNLHTFTNTNLKGMYNKGDINIEEAYKDVYDIDGVKIKTYLDLEKDVTTKTDYDNWNSVKEKWKTRIHEYNAKLGDQFLGKIDTLTEGKSTEYYNKVTDLKFELVNLDKEITYYQWKYEQTRELSWLDKKKALLVERENKLTTNNKTLFELGKKLGFYKETDNESVVESGINKIIGERYYGAWKKENIDDPKEKNKISVDTLTTDLERELNINKQEVIRKERELEDLRQETKQAETNYNSINPSKKDEALYARYTKVKEEITRLASDMKNAETRLKNLQDALTLHDLKNIGENQIAFGTDTLAVGNNSIAMGYKAISVGKDTVSVGARNQSTGEAITALGQDLVTNGNKNISIGNTNVINGENNIVFGRNNKIGTLGDDNKSNGNIVLGSGITVSKDITNSITLGDASTPISNAISVGSTGSERQIKNVKDATDNQDAVTYKQLKEYLKLDGSNVDSDEKRKVLAAKLSENSSLTDPKGILVTDTKVKEGLDGKLDKDLTNLDTSKLNEKLAKGNITSTDITVTGGNNSTFTNVTLELSKNLKDKINSVDNKANKDEVYTKGETDSKIDEKINAIDLSGYAKKDASNIEKDKYTEKLSEGANLTKPTGALVTDTIVKEGLDKKLNNDLSNLDDAGKETLRTNLDVYKKSEVDSKLDSKANKDASNIEVDKFTTKLNDGANIGTPTTKLVTDKNVKDYLDTNYTNNTLLTTKLDAKANKDLSNLSDTDKSTARTNLDVYSKGESDSTFLKKDASNITTEAERKTISGNLSTGADLTTPKGVLVTDSIVKEGLDKKVDKSTLESYLKLDGSNVDTDEKRKALAGKLSENSSLTNPKGILVTDTKVKEGLEGKLDKDLTNLDTSKLNEKLAKGNITSTDITVTGGNNSTFTNVTLELSKDLKDKINSVDNKLDKTGSNLNENEKATLLQNLGLNNVVTSDNLANKANKDLSNVEKSSIIDKAGDGNLDNLNGGLVTDRVVKSALDKKLNNDLSNLDDAGKETLRTNLDVYKKSEVDSKLEGKANKDASNIEVDKFTTKLNDGANIGTPTTKLVTDKNVKDYLDANYTNNTLLTTKLDAKANKDLSNLSDTDKSTARTNLDVYSKGESDSTFLKKDASNITTEAERKTISGNLSTGADLTTPKGVLVTDSIVKEGLDKKANKDDVYTKDEINDKITGLNVDGLAKKDGSNLDKAAFTTNLTNGANIGTPTDTVVTDKLVKEYLDANYTNNKDLNTKLDTKVNKDLSNLSDAEKSTLRDNLNVYDKTTIDSKLDNKANKSDLESYLKLDGSNLTNDNRAGLITKLTDGANATNPIGALVTDTLLKSTVQDTLAKGLGNIEKGDIISTTLTVTGGENKVFGKDVSVELKENSIETKHIKDGNVTKEKLDDKLKKEIDEKLNKDLSNLKDTEKDTLRNNLDVYKKSEVDSKLDSKANKDASNIEVNKFTTKLNTGANIGTPATKLVTDRNVKDYLDTNYYNKKDLDDKVGGLLNSHLLPGSIGDPNDTDKTYLVTDKQVKEYVDKENSRYNTLSSAGVANAIATASLPQVSNNYTFGISAAGGHYNGQNALAVGISGQSDNGRFIYKIGSALNTKSKFSIGVGATVLFGEIVKPNAMNAKENKELREKNSALESKVEKLEQTVKELLKDKETEKVDKSAENEKLIQNLLDKIKELSSKVEMLDSKTKKVK